MHLTDHEGKISIELVTREPTGATYIQQHRVPPHDVQAFVRYYHQHMPNVTIEHVDGRTRSSQPHTPMTPSVAAGSAQETGHGRPQATEPNATGLHAYDKYDHGYATYAPTSAGGESVAPGPPNRPPYVSEGRGVVGGVPNPMQDPNNC